MDPSYSLVKEPILTRELTANERKDSQCLLASKYTFKCECTHEHTQNHMCILKSK